MEILLNRALKPDLDIVQSYLDGINARNIFTNFGPLYYELTERLKELLGVNNLLLVSNGTIALQVAYKTLHVDNAICTPYSYVATASSLMWEKIDTQFTDICADTLNLNPSLVRERLLLDKAINAVVATHVYGNPCDFQAFEKIRKDFGINVIYDAAHAFGVRADGASILCQGDASTLSFHATKIFHTIEGGAIIFNDSENYEIAKRLINFNLDKNGMPLGAGINAKLSEYHCAVGLAILTQIDDILDHRVSLYELYQKELRNTFRLQEWSMNSAHNGAYFPILFESIQKKEIVSDGLKQAGIQSREYFKPSLNHYFGSKDHCPHSEQTADQVLCLPLHFYMSHENVKYVCDTLKRLNK